MLRDTRTKIVQGRVSPFMVAAAMALAVGCETPDEGTSQPAQPPAPGSITYFHNGATLDPASERFVAIMSTPSLVTMVDSQFPRHAWLYTSTAEEQEALRHHQDFAAKHRAAAQALGGAGRAVSSGTYLLPPEYCQTGSYWYVAIDQGGHNRAYTDEPTLTELGANDQISSITIQRTTHTGALMPATRVYQHEWYGGNQLRLLPPPDSNSCAVYNMTDFWFCAWYSCPALRPCTCGQWRNWNDYISSLRWE